MPRFGQDRLCGFGDPVRIHDVHLNGMGLDAFFLQIRAQLFQSGHIDIGQKQFHSEFAQFFGQSAADLSCGAGNECSPVLKFHLSCLTFHYLKVKTTLPIFSALRRTPCAASTS